MAEQKTNSGDRSAFSRRRFLAAATAGFASTQGLNAGAEAMPSNREELTQRSTLSLAGAIRKKEVSSVEVVQACIQRIHEVNPLLNAVVRMDETAALEQARIADQRLAEGGPVGPLHGIPMTLKDSHDTAGMVSTAATKGRENFIPENDSPVAARLREAGAILVGKTNTPEFTLSFTTDNALFGRTNNPYNLEHTPGGSSGGAAAIVAASGIPFDIGSDTAGSIRLPAHCCGIAGLKPTSGRVPRTGHIISFDGGALEKLTTLGPLARRVEDLSLLFPIIAGPDGVDPYVVPVPIRDPMAADLSKLRVAFHTGNGIATPTEETQQTVRAAARVLEEAGCAVEEALPKPIGSSEELFEKIFMQGDAWAWRRRLSVRAGSAEEEDEEARERRAARAMTAPQYTALLEEWDRFQSEMLQFMNGYDLILAPVNAYPALPHEGPTRPSGYSYTETYSLTGWPVAVVRCGTSRDGLPIGVQAVAGPWREDHALAAAQRLEDALGGWVAPR